LLEPVRLSRILCDPAYDAAPSLPLILGKDIGGNPVVADLAGMPHLLVAGAAGSGTSAGIHAMILSLLYKSGPDRLRLILIDFGKLELSIYEDIPHLLAPVVSDAKQAVGALEWCLAEMERRYGLMSRMGVRDIARFNRFVSSAQESFEALDPLPDLVVVIDEPAEIADAKVEPLIARLARKAQGAGIHLILATQRPSVISGLVKASIPARIWFRIASPDDSRVLLDQTDDETLPGQGDMFYLAAGARELARIHGALVADDEVSRVVDYLRNTGAPDYVLVRFDDRKDGDAEPDPLYEQAVELVLKNRRASTALVQRRLRIGYRRAAQLLAAMERAGLVSAMDEHGRREVPGTPDSLR
jgi:S-DNA-T family DNA segregation ATPase FtsK/SpoIIIE